MSGTELFAPIASNKNGEELTKVMTWAIKAKLLRYAIGVMTFNKINLKPH
jgi:hypothetical protein